MRVAEKEPHASPNQPALFLTSWFQTFNSSSLLFGVSGRASLLYNALGVDSNV